MVTNLPASTGDARDEGSNPGLWRSPEVGNGNPLQYSCLKNPMDRGCRQAAVDGVTESWMRLSTHTHIHTPMPSPVMFGPSPAESPLRLSAIPSSFLFQRLLILGGVARWLMQLSDKVGLDWQDIKGTESERKEEAHVRSFQPGRQAPRAFAPSRYQPHFTALGPQWAWPPQKPWRKGALLQNLLVVSLAQLSRAGFLLTTKDMCCGGTSLVVQWLKLWLPMQGAQVQSLVLLKISHAKRKTEDPTCPT